MLSPHKRTSSREEEEEEEEEEEGISERERRGNLSGVFVIAAVIERFVRSRSMCFCLGKGIFYKRTIFERFFFCFFFFLFCD